MFDSNDIERRTKAAISQPWWALPDPVLLDILEKQDEEKNRRLLRFGMWIGTLLCTAFVVFDAMFLPDVAFNLAALRLSVLVGAVVMVEIGYRNKLSLRSMHAHAASMLLLVAFGWLYIAQSSAYGEMMVAETIFATIFVLAVNLFFNFRFSLSVAASATITAGYLYAFAFLAETDVNSRIINGSYFVMTFVLSVYLSWRLGLERYHTFINALQAEIQEQVANEKGEQLKTIAEIDPLTGLVNRRALNREFINISRFAMNGDQQVAVLLIDVDFFKAYNDSLGHSAGDECLIKLAEALATTAREYGGVAGRYSGEAFLTICPVISRGQLEKMAASFCKVVEDLAIEHPGRNDHRSIVTVSIGAAMTENDGLMDMAPLLQQADRALYASKFASRATFTVFDPTSVVSDASAQNLEQLLNVAVDRDLVSLVYQPIVDSRTGQLRGHEALMRLRDFDGSPVHPPVFIPLAEETGAIIELGKWALERACNDLQENPMGEFVSVNVSAVQLRSPGFPLQVAEVLARTGLRAARLALEVTEGIDIYLETQAQKNIEQLKQLGVSIWLDDFGTGFAGLAWLHQFDFDVVKIDRCFVLECQTEQGLALLTDMVRMLGNQKFTVLVEGVETAEQAELMTKLGVDLVQGYHYGRPAALEAIEEQARLVG